MKNKEENLVHEVIMEVDRLLKSGVSVKEVTQACLDGVGIALELGIYIIKYNKMKDGTVNSCTIFLESRKIFN